MRKSKKEITSIELEGVYTEIFKEEMQRLIGTGRYISDGMALQIEQDIYKSLRKSRRQARFRILRPFLGKLFSHHFYDIRDIDELRERLKKKPEPPPDPKPKIEVTNAPKPDQKQLTGGKSNGW